MVAGRWATVSGTGNLACALQRDSTEHQLGGQHFIVATKRKAVSRDVQIAVLTEAGYRCGVPTCRTILAIDIHHIVEVHAGGTNEAFNLLALCPTCHALLHRGEIARDSIVVWKRVLMSMSAALDHHSIDDLIFLHQLPAKSLGVSGDGVLNFRRLIAAGLAGFRLMIQNGPMLVYELGVTDKGESLVKAWMRGDQASVAQALSKEPVAPSPNRTQRPTDDPIGAGE